jgi:acyl-CoA-binding protein
MYIFAEKVGTKALEITYEDKLKLVALSKQSLFGKYKVDPNSQVGFLDVIGNDRRQAWQSLGDMSEQTAMLEFVKTLNKLTPLLKPYVQAYRMEKEETERLQ